MKSSTTIFIFSTKLEHITADKMVYQWTNDGHVATLVHNVTGNKNSSFLINQLILPQIF